ncbi:MAG: hypothetical protein IJU58_00065 [Clostridia bacterium]|nr:hypothetical protein [Clostridia bacterium]
MFFLTSTLAESEASSANSLLDFFSSLVASIDYSILLYVFAGIMLFTIVVSAIGLLWSYEERCMRVIRKINNYLSKHPTVNDNNIVAFNNLMKKLPRRVRDRWQLFMLERDGSPSRYLNLEYCVKRPLGNSAFLQMRNQMKYISIILASLGLMFSLMVAVVNPATSTSSLIAVFANCVITPSVVLAAGFLYIMVLQLRYKYLNTDFYDVFTNFARNIDKASSTLPDYVDYELLFTRKEIDAGIPVLREYLEKKALEEQRLLERARRAEVEHSPYDFDELGVNGQQLIERAVSESENFLLEKIDIQTEINRLEKQKDTTTKNMEDIEREANKRLQAINENLERLDKELAEKTNKVEINFTMGQIRQERDKKTTLEKDLATRLEKEKTAQDALNVEIQKRKEKIDEGKHDVESALKAEYNNFAGRLYDEIYQKVVNSCAEDIHKYQLQIDRLKNKLLEFDKELDVRDTAIKTKDIEIESLKMELSKSGGRQEKGDKRKKSTNDDSEYSIEQNGEVSYATTQDAQDQQNLMSTTTGVAEGDSTSDYSQYYDDQGNAIDYSQNEENNDDNGNAVFYDENGNLIDYSQYYDEFGNLKPEYSTDNDDITSYDNNDTVTQDYDEYKPLFDDSQEQTKGSDPITTNDLLDLQKQIAEENQKLNQQREELRNQIDQTLNSMDNEKPKAAKKPAKKATKSKAASTKTAKTTEKAPKQAAQKPAVKEKTTTKAKPQPKAKAPAKKASATPTKAAQKPAAKKEAPKAEPKKKAAPVKKPAAKKETAKKSNKKDIVALTREIDNLKLEVKNAKARGASDEEIAKINKRIADILKDIANVKK